MTLENYKKIAQRAHLDSKIVIPYFCGYTPNSKIIDVGCGIGTYIQVLRTVRPDLDVYGIDLNKDAIDIAKKYSNNVFVADAKCMPFAKKTFSGCFIRMLFDIVRNSDYEPIIDEVLRIIKPGGKILIYGNIKSSISGYPLPTNFIDIEKAGLTFSRISQYTPFNLKLLVNLFKKKNITNISIDYIVKDNINTPAQDLIDYYTDDAITDNVLTKSGLLTNDSVKLYNTSIKNILLEENSFSYFIQAIVSISV